MAGKILSFVMSFVFLFSTIGYFPLFRLIRQQVREEVRKQLSYRIQKKEITLICLSANETGRIHWIEKGREFILDEQLFDVVKIEQTGGMTRLYCINDRKEKQLLNGLEQYIIQQMAHDSSPYRACHTMVNLIIIDFLPAGSGIPVAESFPFLHFPFYRFVSLPWVTGCPDPPPEAIS